MAHVIAIRSLALLPRKHRRGAALNPMSGLSITTLEKIL
jgi:hypothetical protein